MGAVLAEWSGTVSLRRGYLRPHVKEAREGAFWYPEEEHSRQGKQVQRSWGGNKLGEFEEQREGWCGWRGVSKGKLWGRAGAGRPHGNLWAVGRSLDLTLRAGE